MGSREARDSDQKAKSKQNSKSAAPPTKSGKAGMPQVAVDPPANQEPEIAIPSELPKVGLEDFDLLKVLGKGGFGKVMLVRKKGDTNGALYAMKVLRKEAVIRRNQVAHTK